MTRRTHRATVSAPANIAIIKYWGAKDATRVVPYNPSISMTLEVCRSTTTVEPLATAAGPAGDDDVWLVEDDARLPAPAAFAARVRGHLDVLRQRTGRTQRFRVATRNSFPAAAGLASSASGFAALACAVVRALELRAGTAPSAEPSDDLSVLARLSGSGSAARSVLGGYVEWPSEADSGSTNDPDEGGAAHQLAPASHWDLRDVIALVQSGEKKISSLEGHRRAPTSPYFSRRLELLPARLAAVRRAIETRDAATFGRVLEQDAIDLHAIAMTSDPPIFYWQPATLAVLAAVRELRQDFERELGRGEPGSAEKGTGAWFTMDAGANVHVLCTPDAEEAVAERVASIPGVHGVIRDRVGDGPRDETTDLLALPEAGPTTGAVAAEESTGAEPTGDGP